MLTYRFRQRYIVGLCAGLVVSGLHAQTNGAAPWSGSAFSSDPKELILAATAIKPKQYAKVTIFTEEQRKVFNADGKYTTTSRAVYRVETKEAIGRWGTVKATWSPWRGTRPQIRARVIEPDGAGMDQPNEAIWYGFARIVEDYRLFDVGLSLYSRVGMVKSEEMPTSTYNLARSRERVIQAHMAHGGE